MKPEKIVDKIYCRCFSVAFVPRTISSHCLQNSRSRCHPFLSFSLRFHIILFLRFSFIFVVVFVSCSLRRPKTKCMENALSASSALPLTNRKENKYIFDSIFVLLLVCSKATNSKKRINRTGQMPNFGYFVIVQGPHKVVLHIHTATSSRTPDKNVKKAE